MDEQELRGSEPRRVLIVDDNPDIHLDYKKILSETAPSDTTGDIAAFLGGNVEDASSGPVLDLDFAFSGEEAFEKVQQANKVQRPYAVAFVDMRMPPGWDGLQTIEHLWRVDSDLQVVVCTAYSDSTWADIIERVGRTDKLLILKKPFDAVEVSQLATALTEKWALSIQARVKRDELEELVQKRTRQLQYAALHDPLTDLPNRRCFQLQFAEAIKGVFEGAGVAALALIDLDRFKQVNDSLGHPVGDQLLQSVAARLREFQADQDCVARLGGDEFAMVLRGQSMAEVSARMEAILERLWEPHAIHQQQIVCGGSIGAAIVGEDGKHPEDLTRNADLALYRAKRERQSECRWFNQGQDGGTIEINELELQMAHAVQANEFVLHYQPIVESKTHRIATVEGLVRWEHPTRGLLQPAEFLSLAEETGQIIPIGDWILKKACSDACQWPRHVRVAVNLSAVQFRRGDRLVETVAAALETSGLEAQRLELEITESVLLLDCEKTMATLHKLRGLGVHVVLDDFGIGYSSLSYLRRFPFDKLKLDRSFLKGVTDNEGARLIVHAVARLGESLGLKTTMEGVETLAQMQFVIAEGFDYWQGFLKGRPVPDKELESLMQSELPVSDWAQSFGSKVANDCIGSVGVTEAQG